MITFLSSRTVSQRVLGDFFHQGQFAQRFYIGLRGWVLGVKHSVVSVKLKFDEYTSASDLLNDVANR